MGARYADPSDLYCQALRGPNRSTMTVYTEYVHSASILNLERGCVSHDPITGRWTITGRKFKGARDSDGEKIPEGEMRDDPWVVVHETARAVAVLEQLHDQSLLFHNHVHPHAAYGLAPKPVSARRVAPERSQMTSRTSSPGQHLRSGERTWA